MVNEKTGKMEVLKTKTWVVMALRMPMVGSQMMAVVVILTCLKILVMEISQILVATRLGINTLKEVVALRGPRGFCMKFLF
jgi:hypothetical protein